MSQVADLEVGQELRGPERRVTFPRLWMFSGGLMREDGTWPSINLHTDWTFAEKAGLPRPAASGTQTLSYVADLMVKLFGEAWFNGGQLSDVKFTRPVFQDDAIRPIIVLQDRAEGPNGETELRFDVRCNVNGDELAMVGKATVVVPV